MKQDLIRIVSDLTGTEPEQILNFRPDPGGLNNRSYRFEIGNDAFFLRVPTAQSRLFSDIDNEITLYNALEGRNLSDRVIKIDPKTGIKLSRVETDARIFTGDALSDMSAALKTLRSLHDTDKLRLRKESLFNRARRFLRTAASLDIETETPIHETLAACMEHEAYLSNRPQTVIHGDCLPENILIRPNGSAVLIDFEFVTVSDPLEDIASLYCHLWPTRLSARDLLTAYLERSPSETEVYAMSVYAQLTALTWHIWAKIKMASGENVTAVQKYNERMTVFLTENQPLPIPAALRKDQIRQ